MNIRDAKPEDAEQISALMKELGYEASPDLIKSKDFIKSEVTSGDHRKEAHAFYESCGYARDERRFIKIYGG